MEDTAGMRDAAEKDSAVPFSIVSVGNSTRNPPTADDVAALSKGFVFY